MQTKNVINHKVILNLIQDLPRLPLLNNLQSRCQDPVLKHYGAGKKEISRFGMTALFDKGFTLIELLVVVLIIGILTAVAVPQYQKAKRKTLFKIAAANVEQLYQQQRLYYLANGSFASSPEKLDVSVQMGQVLSGQRIACSLGDISISCSVWRANNVYNPEQEVTINRNLRHVYSPAGLYCRAYNNNYQSFYKSLCSELTEDPNGKKDNNTWLYVGK